jgi:protein-S-isoprenylcysteine O-methyltransferase Ste14
MYSVRKILLIIPSSVFFFLFVPLFSFFFGRRLDLFLELNAFDLGWMRILLSLTILLVGGYYVVESIRILFVQGAGVPLGDVFPNDQSTNLITTGVYGQTRNPMLFGYLLCLISLGIVMISISIALIIPTLYVLIWTIWIKTREEPALEVRFGDQYREYKANTPYLVPRLCSRAY